MRHKRLGFIFVIFAIFIYCQDQPTQIKHGQTDDSLKINITFKIQIPSEIQTYVYSSIALVTASDMDTIRIPLEVTDTFVQGVIENVPAGKNRYFEIFVFDQDSILTYYGSKYADVYAGFVNQIEIMLQPAIETGTVVLFGYFGIPGTEKIVYSSFDSQLPYDDGEIFIMNPDCSNVIQLTNNPGPDYHPQISPKGDKIVFVLNLEPEGFNTHIFVMNVDGSAQEQLTFPPVREDGPSFSPDGNRITYRKTTENGTSNLFVMYSDGSGKINITNDRIGALHPFWANDGFIYFVTHGNDYSIWKIQPDGSSLSVVSPFKVGAHEKVKFSSDMQYIYYDSYQYPNQIMRSDFPAFTTSIPITLGDDTGGFCLSPDNSKILYSQGSHENGYFLFIKDFITNEVNSLRIKAIHSDWKKILN